MLRQSLPLAILLGIMVAAATSSAANYTTHPTLRVTTTDSGFTVGSGINAGDTEDVWTNANSGIDVSIPWASVRITGPSGFQLDTYLDATGELNWSSSHTGAVFTISLYSRTQSASNNVLRMHNASNTISSIGPGSLYSTSITNWNPATQPNPAFNPGLARWTAFAAAAYAFNRFENVTSYWENMLLNVGVPTTSCPGASAHWCILPDCSHDRITQGVAYIVIPDCTGSAQTKNKFVIAHEVGHVIAALFYGTSLAAVDGWEPAFVMTHNDACTGNSQCTPHSCQSGRCGGSPNSCTDVANSYAMGTKEWNALGFREGYAHFLSAVVWNHKDDTGESGWAGEGVFRWFNGVTYDLDRQNNDPIAIEGISGGRMENVCCTSGCGVSWDGAGTNEDWMRHLWDFWHSTGCSPDPNFFTMLNIYRETRLNGGLAYNNYWSKSTAAVAEMYPICLQDDWDLYGWGNGVSHE